MCNVTFAAYLNCKHNLSTVIKPKHIPRTILSFSDVECRLLFRFQQNDLFRLMRVFRIPNEVRLESRYLFYGEEVLLFSLHRFAHGFTYEMDCIILFGREHSQWSRAFHWFIQHMMSNFIHLLKRNLEHWLPHFPYFSECIRMKLEEKTNLQFAPQQFRVIGFVDDNVTKTCRPGGGPTRPGINAPRNNNYLQMAFYNGWKNIMELNIKVRNYLMDYVWICLVPFRFVIMIWKC